MSRPLATLPSNTPAKISAIYASGEMLARMLSWGITLNCPIEILRRGPFQGPLQVQLGHINLMISLALVATIEVTES